MLFFKKKSECTHDRVSTEAEAGYCPDCGKYVENHWYLTRCACCNVKRKTIIKRGKILPHTKFCPNCGAQEYLVERVGAINFIDINFAVLLKEVNEAITPSRSQVWLDREPEPVRLLGLYNAV
ncbi:TPA: hypothetical protein IAD52_03960 [Candidatus Spyradomonas excrementavium]|nr:hypothetical protein [Candidatus Spyradomonas excrementavium]